MDREIWYLIVGLVLVLMALAGSVLKRLPLSASMIYLGLGYPLSSGGMNLLTDHAGRIHSITSYMSRFGPAVT